MNISLDPTLLEALKLLAAKLGTTVDYESAFWLLIGWNLIGLCTWIINEGGLPQ
jgi:hypothetical protein